MKTFLTVLGLCLISFSALASPRISCVATNVYDSGPLKDSFSHDEFPDVSIQADELRFGMSSFTKAAGYKITIKTTATHHIARVTMKSGAELIRVAINKTTKKGVITLETFDLSYGMARIDCK